MCWIKNGKIYLIESGWLVVRPLEDPYLFLSFARLGARRGGEYKHPTEKRIKKWVGEYGLPEKRLRSRGTRENPVSMSVDSFRRSVRRAWEIWAIHKEVWAENASAIQQRLSDPQSTLDRDLRRGFEFKGGQKVSSSHRMAHRSP